METRGKLVTEQDSTNSTCFARGFSSQQCNWKVSLEKPCDAIGNTVFMKVSEVSAPAKKKKKKTWCFTHSNPEKQALELGLQSIILQTAYRHKENGYFLKQSFVSDVFLANKQKGKTCRNMFAPECAPEVRAEFIPCVLSPKAWPCLQNTGMGLDR